MKTMIRFSGYIVWLIVVTLFAVSSFAQPAGFLPRDNNEVEAWQVYTKYKASHEKIKELKARIEDLNKQIALVMGRDAEDVADKMKAVNELAVHEKRKKEALAAWEKKFYWRYGDLRWCDKQQNGVIRDAKRGEMDHIEFALVNFPYDYKPGNLNPQNTKESAPNSLTLELPGYWGHLNYTINGARLDPPTGSDKGKVGGRQYTGELTGNTLSISGTAISDNPTPGPINQFYYEFKASVSAGNESKKTSYIAPVGEKLNQSYSLSIPVKPGMSGSFSISLLYQNAIYGVHGWVVSGSLSPNKNPVITNTKVIAKTTGGISKDGKTWAPLGTTTLLKTGDQVKTNTGQSANMTLAQTIQLLLNKNSWLQVTSESSSSPALKLLDGSLKISLPSLPLASALTIDMSQALVTVKGTVVELWENGQRSAIRVSEGMVEVKHKKTGLISRVGAGQTVFAGGGELITAAPQVKDDPTLSREWGEEKAVFKLESLAGVYNNPPNPTVFTITKPTLITKIMTYHWNNGRGAQPGTISLRNVNTCELVGTWDVTGTSDMNATGPPHRYWMVYPNKKIPAGSYEIVDSDRSTWATNWEMKEMGCAWVWGRE